MKTARWFTLYILLTACVDRINFDTPSVKYQIVVDGLISDQPGPYTVNVSHVMSLLADLDNRSPIIDAKVTLITNNIDEEILVETEPGSYQTGLSTLGKVGNTYKIKIETADGKKYESDTEEILPAGEFQTMRYEFEARTVVQNGVETNSDQINLYVDAKVTGNSNFMRWRSVGTYKVLTFPQLIIKVNPDGSIVPDPPPCSGYEASAGGGIYKARECECCECWVTAYERIPQVSDDQFIQGGVFKDIRVTSIPVTRRTFYDKYFIEVQQMNISEKAFTYWRLIKAQKEGVTNLFQPPAAKLKGNLHALDGEEVQGYFLATTIRMKSIFINREDIPRRLQNIDTIRASCFTFPNSTNIKPSYWK
jgi:hypothetical protein